MIDKRADELPRIAGQELDTSARDASSHDRLIRAGTFLQGKSQLSPLDYPGPLTAISSRTGCTISATPTPTPDRSHTCTRVRARNACH